MECANCFVGFIPATANDRYCSAECRRTAREAQQEARLRLLPPSTPPRPPNGKPRELPMALVTLDAVDRHRRVNCRRYQGCLDHAAALNWRSFSCQSCPVRDEYTAEELREEAASVMPTAGNWAAMRLAAPALSGGELRNWTRGRR